MKRGYRMYKNNVNEWSENDKDEQERLLRTYEVLCD